MLKKKNKKTAITTCNNHQETKAVWYCKQCKIYMCDGCKTAHDSLFKNHNVISIASLTSFDLYDGKCAEHGRELDFICNDCNGTLLYIFAFYI